MSPCRIDPLHFPFFVFICYLFLHAEISFSSNKTNYPHPALPAAQAAASSIRSNPIRDRLCSAVLCSSPFQENCVSFLSSDSKRPWVTPSAIAISRRVGGAGGVWGCISIRLMVGWAGLARFCARAVLLRSDPAAVKNLQVFLLFFLISFSLRRLPCQQYVRVSVRSLFPLFFYYRLLFLFSRVMCEEKGKEKSPGLIKDSRVLFFPDFFSFSFYSP